MDKVYFAKTKNDLCDLLIEEKIEMSWAAQVRSDLAQDPELVNKMARAGLKWVYIAMFPI